MNGGNQNNNRSAEYHDPQVHKQQRPSSARPVGGKSNYTYKRPTNVYHRTVPPQRRYPPSRRPNRKNQAAAVIVAVLMLVILVSVMVSVRSCSNNRTDADDTGTYLFDTDTSAVTDTDGEENMIVGTAEPKAEGKLRICVDPGHGYDDIGASHANLGSKNEEDINLEVALKLVPLLEYEGYDVIMTRDSDTPPDYLQPNDNGQYLINPTWRSEYANRNDVDLFISLHCNSYESSQTSGIRLYYCSDSTYDSKTFAEKLGSAIANNLGISLPEPSGAEYDNAFAVTKYVKAPSVLVEMGFVTNESDAEKLLDDEWQNEMAQALARGIQEYLEG